MFGIEDNPLKRIRLTPGKRVELLLPGSPDMPVSCVIAAVKDESVYLEIPQAFIEVVLGLKGERIILRHTTGRDVFNLGTRLFDCSIGNPFVAILRLLDGHSRQMQRRIHRRCEVRIPVSFTVTMAGLEGENELLRRHPGETMDMGLGGVLFRTPFRVEPGRGITVFVEFEDSRLALGGRAIRRRPYPDGGFEVAVAFTAIKESSARLLDSFLESGAVSFQPAGSPAWGQ